MTVKRDYASIAQKIEGWLRDYLDQSGSSGFIVGMSGGIDSSVTAILCRHVTDATLGLILPCGYYSHEDISDAQYIAKKFKIETINYDLTPVYHAFLEVYGVSSTAKIDIPLANLKARLRMITLYYEANKRKRLVVGTGNRTELAFGYFTKYGDAGVDILPLGSLLKREVRALAQYLVIPEHIIIKSPSAGLWAGQTDEEELGATYEQLDELVVGRTPKGLSSKQIKKLRQQITISEHKRKLPPICPI
ncbi:MAG: NAD(+) synthase [Promethearchaeota archaeon]